MFGYVNEENYSHSIFGFCIIGMIIVLFFIIAFVMTVYTQDTSLSLSGQILD